MMLSRRNTILGGAFVSLAALAPFRGRAQSQSSATAFIDRFGSQLIAVVNGQGSLADKEKSLRPLIEQAVDVDGIARFCLGRFVNTATPQQVSRYTALFHSVLVDNITSKVGEFRGVSFRMAETTQQDGESYVGTVVTRPNQAPTNVKWVVMDQSGSPKIIDVIAEGTSLRLTQRSDYASFLSHHGYDVSKLIGAMRQQVSQGS